MAFKPLKNQVVQPINLSFRYLPNRSRVEILVFGDTDRTFEGHIVGFDENMNLVLDDAEELNLKTNVRKSLGLILFVGESIAHIRNISPGPI